MPSRYDENTNARAARLVANTAMITTQNGLRLGDDEGDRRPAGD